MIRILNRASQVGNGSVSIRLFSSSNSVKDKYDVVIVGGGNNLIIITRNYINMYCYS
jgi:hypothetical protein